MSIEFTIYVAMSVNKRKRDLLQYKELPKLFHKYFTIDK